MRNFMTQQKKTFLPSVIPIINVKAIITATKTKTLFMLISSQTMNQLENPRV